MSFSSHAGTGAKFNPVLEQAKEYAFAACVMYRYDGSPLASEADAWAAGAIENGNLSVDNYAAIAALAKNAPAPGMTQDGVPMKLRGCFDFVNSNEFLAKVKKITKSRPR